MVSVILPVWNGERFLKPALNSISAQTLKNFELVIVDDASTDKTSRILREYTKIFRRLKLVRNLKRRGVGATLNRAISLASGEYLARADADDIMAPDRLEHEMTYLKKHPNTVAVGSWMKEINSQGKTIGERRMPVSHQGITEMMFYAMGMQNPTVMFNRKLIPKDFTWCKTTGFVDDLDLLFRLLPFGKFANIPEYLTHYRIHKNNLSLKNPRATFLEAQQIREDAVKKHHYRPSLKSQLINKSENLLINLLPDLAILPAYNVFRKLTS